MMMNTDHSYKKQINIMGIIGIRSGSKGVKDKNIKLLNGKPLVGWIIEKALKSKYINKLVVSTDSENYKKIAEDFGAEVPCLRPNDFAGDNSPEIDYVRHMLEQLKQQEDYEPDIVVRMMATVPLQTTDDIDQSISKLIQSSDLDSVVVIAEARQHPLKALKIVKDQKNNERLVTYFSNSGREVTPIARQNYDKAYYRSNIIACKKSVIDITNSLTGDNVSYYIIPQDRAIDIDNPIDFQIVESLVEE
jgi:N-acylneuraminate cytidylyltransferase/CMP-N,N'-diacetyllegionaminic acid synthase